ncbi:MAG: hypothetical protein JWN12_1, partial [Candidatus Saccharibacteria bacterium]|nr:hypothetical protein [Candidatus Saccharibacteria bacterium]
TNTDPEAHTDVQTNPTPAAPSPAVRRSSGRFMDVVHSSSDMRPSTGSRPSMPSVPSLHREEVAERDEVANRPEPAAAPSAAFHWTDPIDVAEPTPDLIEEVEPSFPEPAAEVTEEPPIAHELEDENEDKDASPLESPFLTDTKVEKRPLGAFSGADADLPLLEDPIPFSANVAPQPQPESVSEVEEPAHEEHEEMPYELHPDLLALEGHGQEDQKESSDDELFLEATNPPDPEPVLAVEDVPTGPTSITQQYTEQPSTASEPSGSIFDTEAYHQPLTHPAKKRSKVLIIVWIIALILVGGGIGAGIYFVVLPMLG